MTGSHLHDTSSVNHGEGLMLAAAVPGIVAMVALGLVLAFERMGWAPPLVPFGFVLGHLAILSPLLVPLGAVTLILGAINMSHVGGRRSRKLGLLLGGVVAWAIAAYWLSVPGLIDLP